MENLSPYEKSKILPVKAGEFIFKEKETGDFAYLIEEGEIEIVTEVNGEILILNTLGVGGLFGEMALIDQRPRSASARASQDTILTVITPEQIKERLQLADPILKMLLLTILNYFRLERNYSRKLSGTDQSDLLTEDLSEALSTEKAIAVDLIRMESELHTAINEEQLQLQYQPIVHLETNQITGFEALLRWQSPTRGYVSPDIFIALAESTSLILAIGRWVIEKGLLTLKHFQEKTGKSLFMSINITNRQIEKSDFLDWLAQVAKDKKIQPSQIKLEIIERSLLLGKVAQEWIVDCQRHGFLIVIDDFGTGYSNLSYLTQYQFDTLKIDKSFIQDLEKNSKNYQVCRTIIELSKLLGMTVVAEGIEQSSHRDILQELGCTFGQGYYYSKPLDSENALALLKQDLNLHI